MADTFEREVLQNFDEDEQKNPMPYNGIVDFSTILSGININVLKSLLEALGKAYKQMSNEQIVISLALQDLQHSSIKRKVAKEFMQSVLKLVEGCFRETEALPISKRAIAQERTFVEKRSTDVHYMAVKKSWEKLVFEQSQSVCAVSVELLLQQVLQHFWYTGSSGSQDANVSNADCLPTTSTSTIDPNQDNDSIRDHAGWAV
jgi:hypothetical protein